MVDHKSTVTVGVKDETKSGVDSILAGQRKITAELLKQADISTGTLKAMRHQARQTHQSLDELLKARIKFNKETERIHGGGKPPDPDPGGKTKSALKGIAGELAGMAARYATVAFAANEAKKAFLGFAETERKLLVMQNATKMTTAELGKFEQRVRTMGRATHTGIDESLEAIDTFREGMNISIDEATKRMPRLIAVAKGLDVAPKVMAKAVSDLMRNLKIPAEQTKEALEIIGAAATDAGVNVKDLSANTAELAEVSASLGNRGTKGLATTLVLLGEAAQIMGDTSKGAALLKATLASFESDQMGNIIRGNANKWREEIQAVKDEGGDVAGYVMGQWRQLSDRQKQNAYHQMGRKERELINKLDEDNNGTIARKIKLIESAKNSQAALNNGRRVMEGTAGTVESLSTSLKDLYDQFGKLMVAFAVPKAINILIEKMKALESGVKMVTDVIKILKGQGSWEDAKSVGNKLITPQERSGLNPFTKWKEGERNPFFHLGWAEDPAVTAQKRMDAEIAKENEGTIPLGPGGKAFKPPEYTPLRFGGGMGGGDGGEADVGGWRTNSAWDAISARGRAGHANFEDRRDDDDSGESEYTYPSRAKGLGDLWLNKAVPGSHVARLMKEDARPGPNQHAIRTKLRGMLGIEDPGEPAPWDRTKQAAQAYRLAGGGEAEDRPDNVLLTGQGGPSALGGLTGAGAQDSERKYGSSMDAKYLTAAYRPGGGVGGGGGGSAGVGGGTFSPAGPQGAYGPGTGYGPNGMLPRTSTTTTPPAETTTPPAGPESGPGGVPVQPGTVAPNLPPELGGQQPAAATATAGGTASGDYQGNRVNQEVMQTRIQQSNSEWMKDPKNQQKIFRTLQAEGGANIGANLEQMSNYAASRNLTLQQVVEARGKRQFYGPLKRFHGDPGSGPMMAHERDAYNSAWTPEKQKLWDKAYKDVFSGGSNRINYLTDQGTVGDPNYDPNKMTKVGGNMFGVQPGTERWVGAQRGKAQVAGPVTVASNAQTAAIPPGGAAQPLPPELGGPQPGAAAAAPAASGGGNLVEEAQERVAGTRKGKLDPRLRDALEGAAAASGVRIRVTSGGQRMHGAPGHTGSHRHDQGKAADVDVIDPKTGKVLPLSDPRRLKVLEEAARRGAGGSGARYMDDPNKIHMGITGSRSVVGEGLGAYAGTPEEKAAVARGLKDRLTPAQMEAERVARSKPATPTAVAAPSESKPMPPVADDAAGASRPAQTSEELTTKTQNVAVNLKVNQNDVQFARSSMRRQADKEVREARWNSYADIGCA